jgi:GntR family transcriptional repressor for pyruvate dehydrogenase complex
MARLHQNVMRILIGEIVSGEIAPGDWLPRETDIAEQHDVSRGVAREVIRGLEERGLVTVRHGRGAKVAPPARWEMFDVDVLAAHLAGPGRSKVLREYLECRRLLDIEACAMAAERATPNDVQAIEDALQAMRQSAERPHGPAAETEFHEADIAFHRAIIDATGNAALSGLVERIHAALLAARYPLARPADRLKRSMPEHEAIAEAIRGGDPSAAREAMRAHLDTIAGYLDEELAAAEA